MVATRPKGEAMYDRILTADQRDRAVGVLLGTAAGDALGAGYEFGPPRPDDYPIAMIGGGIGPFAPGEWTDDTSMAIAIAEVAATGADLLDDAELDRIVRRWHGWSRSAKDVGIQTRSVLSASAHAGIGAASARQAAAEHHDRAGRSGGNGSLMRTAPVALAYLSDEVGLVEAARVVGELTHFDPEAGDACVLWCLAIRHGVLTGEIDARIGLGRIDSDRRELWSERLDVAERSRPADFTKNGWVVHALQGAWSAIATTLDAGGNHLKSGLESAVRGGHDTDTVAAIAGGLLGAAYGVSAVPVEWMEILHGWPGMDAAGLADLADRIVSSRAS